MSGTEELHFGPYRFDPTNARLWCGSESIALTPKAFDVLAYLATRPGQLVTKEQLLQGVWDDRYVSDASLVVCIREIRKALQDQPRQPRYIETVHRRGYRFIGESTEQATESGAVVEPEPGSLGKVAVAGLTTETQSIREAFEQARRGERRIVFVTGGPGSGKTTLVEAFLSGCSRERVRIGCGNCFEHFGTSEPYFAILEALSQLCRAGGDGTLLELLASHAPTWLVQMPWLHAQVESPISPREVLGATPERMLREMGEVLETLTADVPLILVLEDLHWSDLSTVDFISALARRRQPARLLLLGTFRPKELHSREHPLEAIQQELETSRCSRTIGLQPLSVSAIREYLTQRFGGYVIPSELVEQVHRRTDGHPLFVVNLIDYLLANEFIVLRQGNEGEKGEVEVLEDGQRIEQVVPDSIRPMIAKQVDRASAEEQQVLEGASVVGVEHSAGAVAAVLEMDMVKAEELCEALARRSQLLQALDECEWPDGTVATRYRFVHQVYQDIIYDAIPAARRRRFHLRLGRRLESAFANCEGEVAGELARHFERGNDFYRAIRYCRLAAETATRRFTNREALQYLDRALRLVDRLADADRVDHRLAILEQRGLIHRAGNDMEQASADFEQFVTLAREARRIDRAAQGLFYLASALSWLNRERCLGVVSEVVSLSERISNTSLHADAKGAAGYWRLLWKGWRDEDALMSSKAVSVARQTGDRVMLRSHLARHSYFQTLRSEYGLAAQVAEEATALALETGDSFEYMLCHFFWAWAALHQGKFGQTWRILWNAIPIAEKNGHRRWQILFRLQLGWLYLHGRCFETACSTLEASHVKAYETNFPYGQVLADILLGQARLGLGDWEGARIRFEKASDRLDEERVLMAWILRMLLSRGWCEYWSSRGESRGALDFGEELCEVAGGSGENTYLTFGHNAQSRIRLEENRLDEAEAHLVRAIQVTDAELVPLASWQTYLLAAELHEKQDQSSKAELDVRRCQSLLSQLVDDLEESNEVRVSIEKYRDSLGE